MPDAGKKVTKADLAFIDAAIQLHRASQAPKGAGVSIDASSFMASDGVELLVAAVDVAVTMVYHYANSSLIGEDNELLQRGRKLGLAPHVSLDKLVAERNKLAHELGV